MATSSVYRGIICKIEIIKGSNVLKLTQSYTRDLYNFTRYCAISYNYRLRQQRGDWFYLGAMPKYPGAIGMWVAMHDTEEFKKLNSKTANYILRHFDGLMRSWFSNLKNNPKARPPKYAKLSPPLTFEAGINAKHLGMNIWKLTALRVTVNDRYIFVKIYLPPKTNPDRVESIKILHDGRCAVSYIRNVKPSPGNSAAAIDLGINRIVTIAFEDGESILYPGGLLLSKQRYFLKKIAACKPSGYNENKTSKKKSDHYYSYFEKWEKQKRAILDNLTASIIHECNERNIGTILVGSLKGLRQGKDFGKEMNQKLHAWPFAEVKRLLKDKAELFGIEVKEVDEAYTSRTCILCEFINPKHARYERGNLRCRNCGLEIHADVNGAFNILKKYLPADRQLGVVARLRGLPSTGMQRETGEIPLQIVPTFSAKFDLRNYAVKLNRC